MTLQSVFLLVLLAGSVCRAQTVVRNTAVVDVENKKILRNQTVVMQEGRIVYIGKDRQYKLAPGTEVIDGTGKYLVPGLIDAHVHFFQSGGIYTRPDVIDLRKYRPYATEVAWTHQAMEEQLRRYTRAGITTVIDVGATLGFLQQRDSFRNQPYAPEVYMTGPLLTTWEPPVYKNLGNDEPFFEMKTAADARRYVQQQLPYRPDFIKIWYIVTDRDTEKGARAHLPLVQAVIEEAHKANLRVAVHATERITAQLAVEAGADFLVHGIDDEVVDDQFLQLLKSRRVVVSPTLVVGGNYGKVLGQQYRFTEMDKTLAHPAPLGSVLDLAHLPDTALTRRYRQVFAGRQAAQQTTDSILLLNTRKMVAAGVAIATGTDAGNIGTQHASSYFDELQALHRNGMNLWQLLEASTLNGAKAVGRENELGSLRNGKKANAVLLSANPLESLQHWAQVEWVVNKGVAWKPDSVLQPTPVDLAQQQLNAYNAHDLEAFLAPYAEDVEIFTFPDQPRLKGKAQMRSAYTFITRTPGLYCELQHRIVQGNTVIDHEKVYRTGAPPTFAVAIYTIENGKIRKVHFVR